VTTVDGLRIVPGYLDRAAQAAVREALQDVLARAPLYTPRMPKTGRPMSVRMTNCGPLGWVTDEHGYRYQPMHPDTGGPWPPMPEVLLDAWRDLAG
jgi:DNA oxidative demethylase